MSGSLVIGGAIVVIAAVMMQPSFASVAALLAIVVPAVASAHIVKGESIGFVSGFLHPLSGFDHIIAMVAVGIWGAQLGRPAIWALPARMLLTSQPNREIPAS